VTDNVLDYLREQFARVHQRLDAIDRRLDETTKRLTSIEREIAGMQRTLADRAETAVNDRTRMDDFDARLSRIERRLELT